MKDTLYGELTVIGMRGCEKFVSQVDAYLKEWRRHDSEQTFLAEAECPRFGSGEAKGMLHESLRGLYADCGWLAADASARQPKPLFLCTICEWLCSYCPPLFRPLAPYCNTHCLPFVANFGLWSDVALKREFPSKKT